MAGLPCTEKLVKCNGELVGRALSFNATVQLAASQGYHLEDAVVHKFHDKLMKLLAMQEDAQKELCRRMGINLEQQAKDFPRPKK